MKREEMIREKKRGEEKGKQGKRREKKKKRRRTKLNQLTDSSTHFSISEKF